MVVAVASKYPDWKEKTLSLMRPLFESTQDPKGPEQSAILKLIQEDAEFGAPQFKKTLDSKVMPFVADFKVRKESFLKH